jgi:plasmid stabilization system protein ParE
MEKEVIWSKRAVKSYNKILKYLEENWNEKQIDSFIFKTEKTLLQIASNTIKFRSAGKFEVHEVLVTKHNLLIYRIKNKKIELVSFYDTRQHPKKKNI